MSLTTSGIDTMELAVRALSLQENWRHSRTSTLSDVEAVEIAYLGFPRRERDSKFPDYKLAELLAIEHLQFWREVKQTQAA